MGEGLKYRPVRLDPADDERLVALAEAKMGGNVSKMLRVLLSDALDRAEGKSAAARPRPAEVSRQNALTSRPSGPTGLVETPEEWAARQVAAGYDVKKASLRRGRQS